MPTPSKTSPISFLDIQNEYGGAAPISLNEYYRGGIYVPTVSSTNTTGVLNIPTSGTINADLFRGLTKSAKGNRLFTSDENWTVPTTSGGKISMIAIGGGGGGGGGSNRTQFAIGGGGGGSGGAAYYVDYPIAAGTVLAVRVGVGGGPGNLRDGVFGAANMGASGPASFVIPLGGSAIIVRGNGGYAGAFAQYGTAGAGGTVDRGSQLLVSTSGSAAGRSGESTLGPVSNSVGGPGAKGFIINAAIDAASKAGYGLTGQTFSTNTSPITGTLYGAGGCGGGCVQGDVGGQPLNRRNATTGNNGCVFIWWNY